MNDCLFCKIIAREIPGLTIYEDDSVLAILDIHPKALGHAMVLPKRHYRTILDVPPGELGPIFAAVQMVVAAEEKSLRPDGFTIGVNHGEVAGQAVPHLHIHVLPRFKGDGGGSIHSIVDKPGLGPIEETQKKILEAIKGIK